MQSALNFYHSHYDIIRTVALFIAASGVVSILLQNIKRWLSLQSDKVIHFLLVLFSFAAAATNYLIGAASQNPKVLGPETIMLVGGATTAYRFLIKPASNLLVDASKERERKARQALSDEDVATVSAPLEVTDHVGPVIPAMPPQTISISKPVVTTLAVATPPSDFQA